MTKRYLSDTPLTFEELFEEGENPYDKRRFFKFALWSESKETDALVDDLISEYQIDYSPIRYDSKLQTYRDTLRVILCNALAYQSMDIIVSLNRSEYSFDKRYNPANISYRITISLLEFLDAKGYIALYRGDKGTKGAKRRSQFEVLPRLTYRMSTYGFVVSMLSIHTRAETVELKRAKKLSGYNDRDITYKRRETLKEYNEFLNSNRKHITILEHPVSEPIHMRCIFTDNLGRGGRVYGGLWQNTKKLDRKGITLYRQETVEVDIRNCSLSMAMHLSGYEIEGDLYDIQGYPRELVKQAIQTMFNISARSDKDGINRTADSLGQSTGEDKAYLKQMVRVIHEHYSHLSDWFFTGQGLMLQFYDSEVCFRVIEEFIRRRRIVLTIHDSFIVAKEDQGLLEETLRESYQYVIGKLPILRVE